jgi:hypothetical protein
MAEKKTYSLRLYRLASAVSQAQYRGMAPTSATQMEMVLSADTEGQLLQMARVAEVDGWRK